LYAQKDGEPDAGALIQGMMDFYRSRMIMKNLGEVIPHFEGILHEYESRKIVTAKQRKGKEINRVEELEIEKFIKKAYKHDVYQETVDWLKSESVLDVVDWIMKWNAYAALSLDLHAQEYNFIMGQTWNLVMEPTMFVEHIVRLIQTTSKNILNCIPGINLKDDSNLIKLTNLMTNMRIGVAKQALTDRSMLKRLSNMGNLAFKPMTWTERINQGVLTYGFISELRGGKDNIWAAYDNKGVIKPGMEDKALTETEMQMLRFFMEGIQGYYGFSRGQYSYYAVGRLAGMFRFPWQIAQINNMFGKYKIDATQMEHVGFVRSAFSTLGNMLYVTMPGIWFKSDPGSSKLVPFKTVKTGTEKDFRDIYDRSRSKNINEMSTLEYLIHKQYGLRDRNWLNRFNRAWENLPDENKKSFSRMLIYSSLAAAAFLLYLEWKAREKEIKRGIPDSQGEEKSGFWSTYDYATKNQMDAMLYRKQSKAKRKMTLPEFKEVSELANKTYLAGNYLNDIMGISVTETYKNPTAVISLVRKGVSLFNAAKDYWEATQNPQGLSPKEVNDLLYVSPQTTRPGFPVGSSKLMNALFNSPFLWGFGNTIPEFRKYERELDVLGGPELDYKDLHDYYRKFPVSGTSGNAESELQQELDFEAEEPEFIE
jgi:hypothetical protein